MDRPILYDQASGRDYDVLNGFKSVLYALGQFNGDLLGSTATLVTSPAATQTSPASLNISLAAFDLYQLAAIDATPYGSLNADSALTMQQGFAAAQSVLLSTAGLTAGQSRWALIEAAFSQADEIPADDPNSGILPYFNVADPTGPAWSGPNNSGTAQNTRRQGLVQVRVIYGAVATTGSEVPPNPDTGFVPLYLVDLTFGQTTITTGQILLAGPSVGSNVPGNYTRAPILTGLLGHHHGGISGQGPQILMSELASASSSRGAGGIATCYSFAGNPNGNVAGTAASGGGPADLCLDTTHNILYFCTTTGTSGTAVWTPVSGQSVNFVGGTSTGSANAQVINPVTPAGFSLTSGYSITWTPGFANTSATQINVGGTGLVNLQKVSGGSLVNLVGGELSTSAPATANFNGTVWVLQTSVSIGALGLLNIGYGLANDGAGNAKVSSAVLGLAAFPTGLVGSAAGGTPTASWTVQEILAETALGGQVWKGANQTLNFNGAAANGANALDTGAMPTNADLAIYAITNGAAGGWATLGTVACNGPVYTGGAMPAGYVASRLIWAGKTDGSGNIVAFKQLDRDIAIAAKNIFNNATSSGWAAQSIASAVPAIAKNASGILGTSSGSAANPGFRGAAVAATAGPGGMAEQYATYPASTSVVENYEGCMAFSRIPLFTAQTLYWNAVAAGTNDMRMDICGYSL